MSGWVERADGDGDAPHALNDAAVRSALPPQARLILETLAATPEGIARAADLLRAGKLVAFPTETVYGLGARADVDAAVLRIFEAKGRPSGNPLIVHVANEASARALASDWTAAASALAKAFWPGPLTLVVERKIGGETSVSDACAASGSSVGLRVPEHPIARALIEAAGVPVAAPSANRSNTISPTTAAHVAKTLADAIDAILDGGATGFGIESTIVDVRSTPARLLRHGAIAIEALRDVTPIVDATGQATRESDVAPAPGNYARHYAPRATLLIAEGVPPQTLLAIDAGARVGALVLEGSPVPRGASHVVKLPANADGFAAGLYAALHHLDDAGCDVILAAPPPEGSAWAAVRDRLRRASTP